MSEILPRQDTLDIAGAIEHAARFLRQHELVYGHGTSNADDEAAWLVLESAGMSPIAQPDYEASFPVQAISQCEGWLRQRALERIPVAYLTGRTWFAGLEMRVDGRALVPRSPIAELIVERFDGWFDCEDSFGVLDLCTGGGCIALATAWHCPTATVTGTDISADALQLAQQNRAALALESRVKLQQSDLFDQVDGCFDLILSNPPYVDADDIGELGEEYLHEPAIGLASGLDGLDITRRILREAADHLSPQGLLVVEVGNSAPALEAAYPDLPFEWIEFEHGGDGVFVLSREELLAGFGVEGSG